MRKKSLAQIDKEMMRHVYKNYSVRSNKTKGDMDIARYDIESFEIKRRNKGGKLMQQCSRTYIGG